MARTELSNSKSICVLGVVICCFAILWPKIFLPMLQTALSMSSTDNEISRSESTPLLPPKVREAMKLSRPEEFRRLAGRPFQRDAKLNTNDTPNKTGGLMGLVMPLYTIGIIVFFLYTILKMVFKNKNEKQQDQDDLERVEQLIEEKPIISDFQMDPEYRKFLFSEEYDENGKPIKLYEKSKQKSKLIKNMHKSDHIVQAYGKDKVAKALHILIRDMEEYKTKLMEVEQTKRQLREVGSRLKRSDISYKETQNEEYNEKNETEDQLNELIDENVVKDDENDNNLETEEQMKTEFDINLNNESQDSESDDKEEDRDLSAQEEYEHKEKMMDNLEAHYWETLLEGMRDLKQTSTEE